MAMETAIQKHPVTMKASELKLQMREVALKLRELIINAPKRELPHNLTFKMFFLEKSMFL